MRIKENLGQRGDDVIQRLSAPELHCIAAGRHKSSPAISVLARWPEGKVLVAHEATAPLFIFVGDPGELIEFIGGRPFCCREAFELAAES